MQKGRLSVLGLLLLITGMLHSEIGSYALEQTTPVSNETAIGDLGGRIDQYLSRITPFGFSGAVLVAKDNQIILKKGYGMADRENGIFNTSETVFPIGALTQQFTAAAIMKLEMQGLLKTSDVIAKYLTDVPKDKQSITIHQLLTHTSGLEEGGLATIAPGRDEEISSILSKPLEAKPGTKFVYSNAGYTLLAAIVEIVSKKTFDDFLKEFIFKPARMEKTGYQNSNWQDSDIVVNYVGNRRNGKYHELNIGKYPNWKLMGNNGLCSTVSDMYRWYSALMGDQILSEEVKKRMFTSNMNNFGYGWFVFERKEGGRVVQQEGGSSFGNAAEIKGYLDNNLVTIAFCNWNGGNILLQQLQNKLEILTHGGNIPLPPAVLFYDVDVLQKYSGVYSLPGQGNLMVRIVFNSLKLRPIGQSIINLVAFPRGYDDELNLKLNEWSQQMLGFAVKGDFQQFESFLEDKKTAAVQQSLISRILARHKMKNPEIIASGTMPSELMFDGLATTIELKEGDNLINLKVHWKNDKVFIIQSPADFREFLLTAMPSSPTEFQVYHIGSRHQFKINFKLDDQKKITGLSINKIDFIKE